MKKEISLILLIFLIVGSSGISSASALVEFRSIDGSGNNFANPSWGQANTPLLRNTNSDYNDGTSEPRGGNPSSIVSARSVSNAVSAQSGEVLDPNGASDMLWLWGQFLDHDIDLTGGAEPAESFNIPVPTGDPFFDPFSTGAQEIPLSRSAFQNVAGVREQVNQITAYIDASNVYGSDVSRSNALRAMDGSGKLLVGNNDLLPLNTGGFPNAPDTSGVFFFAGDVRANEQISLTAMHTLFVREHNRLADEIMLKLNNGDVEINQAFTESGLSKGDFVYQSARFVVGAQLQHITYNEFLPILLGPNALPAYTGYDDSVNAQIDNEFSTAAYRVGHTMLSSFLQRVNEDGTQSFPLELRFAFFNPTNLQASEDLDNILRGMAVGRAQKVDTLVVDDVRNFLFGPPGSGGFDLASLNIQRGRDHGLPTYNDVRTLHPDLTPRASFAEVTSNPVIAAALASVYPTVDDIDLWVGGLAESPHNGGMVGQTFFALLSDQFERLRDGDRFFYLNNDVFSQLLVFEPNFLDTRLSDIILRNTGINSIQQNVFFAMDRIGQDTDGDGIADEVDPDDDNDGIPDTLDTLPTTFSGSFADDATTFGHIISRGDQTVTILDESNPAGVMITSIGVGGNPATISTCGYDGMISLDSGDSIILTCGSVEITVVSGTAQISYQMGPMTITGTLSVGPPIIIDPNSFTITTGANPITILINGVETTILPNQTMEFDIPPGESQIIGGAIIPIDTGALLIAGIGTSAYTIFGIIALAGVGIAVFKLRRA